MYCNAHTMPCWGSLMVSVSFPNTRPALNSHVQHFCHWTTYIREQFTCGNVHIGMFALNHCLQCNFSSSYRIMEDLYDRSVLVNISRFENRIPPGKKQEHGRSNHTPKFYKRLSSFNLWGNWNKLEALIPIQEKTKLKSRTTFPPTLTI